LTAHPCDIALDLPHERFAFTDAARTARDAAAQAAVHPPSDRRCSLFSVQEFHMQIVPPSDPVAPTPMPGEVPNPAHDPIPDRPIDPVPGTPRDPEPDRPIDPPPDRPTDPTPGRPGAPVELPGDAQQPGRRDPD
jgi:hypothetical protein